jgi:hypothetical protein
MLSFGLAATRMSTVAGSVKPVPGSPLRRSRTRLAVLPDAVSDRHRSTPFGRGRTVDSGMTCHAVGSDDFLSCRLEQRFRVPLPADTRRADARTAEPGREAGRRRRLSG